MDNKYKQMSIIDITDSDDTKRQLALQKSIDWKWSMENDYPLQKNGLKVFSCFACGGGEYNGI